jgi:hypothetical protein
MKDPRLVNTASLLHLCWTLVTSEDQWAQMCRARYIKNGIPVNYKISSSVWSGMKAHIRLVYENSILGQLEMVRLSSSGQTDGWINPLWKL